MSERLFKQYERQLMDKDRVIFKLESENAALKREAKRQPQQGWICPKCGGVYAIWVAKCWVCDPKKVSTDFTDWELP